MTHPIFHWVLANFNFSMLVLSIPFIIVNLFLIPSNQNISKYGIIYRWISFFPVGVAGIYWFFMHVFLPDFTASMIGWENNPFQVEVGLADLAFGMLGIIAFWNNYFLRLANVIGTSLFLGGISIDYIFQMIMANSFSWDMGSWFWTFLFLPSILIFCLCKSDEI
jgi:hypothetical protein